MNKIKYCKFCDKEKPEEDFCKSGGYIKNICRDCQNKKQKQIYQDSKRTKQLEQEIERLNNIINEFEKVLKDNIDMCDFFINTATNDLQELGARQNGKTYYQTILLENKIALKIYQKELNKLQELKGSGNNE